MEPERVRSRASFSESRKEVAIHVRLPTLPFGRLFPDSLFSPSPPFAAVIQQSVGSLFLDAIHAKGSVALVPTTSIFTSYDDVSSAFSRYRRSLSHSLLLPQVIQPELIAPTSRLNGATVVRVQDACGPLYIVEHFTIPFISYGYALALDALKNKRAANTANVSKDSCTWLLSDYVLADKFTRGPAILKQAVNDALCVSLSRFSSLPSSDSTFPFFLSSLSLRVATNAFFLVAPSYSYPRSSPSRFRRSTSALEETSARVARSFDRSTSSLSSPPPPCIYLASCYRIHIALQLTYLHLGEPSFVRDIEAGVERERGEKKTDPRRCRFPVR